MSYSKFLASMDKIVVNFTNETLPKFRPLVSAPKTLNLTLDPSPTVPKIKFDKIARDEESILIFKHIWC